MDWTQNRGRKAGRPTAAVNLWYIMCIYKERGRDLRPGQVLG